MANLYPIKIVDVYYGNAFSAQAEKDKGTRGVMIKAGQGGWSTMEQSRAMIDQCEKIGLPYGFYWVIDARYDSGYHMGAIKKAFPDMWFGKLGLWWDCEKPIWTMEDKDYWKCPYAGTGLIEAVTDKFFQWCGKTGGLYTAPGFAKLLNWSSWLFKVKPVSAKLARMPLWVAQYNSSITKPDLFGRWTNWVFWQYTPEPDYNYFNGTDADFKAMFDVTDIEIPKANPTYKVNTMVLNVRADPSTNQLAVGKIYLGNIVESQGLSSDKLWVNIKMGSLVGWCSKTYLTLLTGTEDDTETPIPKEDGLLEERTLFSGKALYKKYKSFTPRGEIIYHVMKVLRKDAEIFITPPPRNVKSVPNFLKDNNLDICINGDGWTSVKISNIWRIIMSGFNASRGISYGTPNNEQTFYITESGMVSITKAGGLWNAMSFPNILVENCQVSPKIKRYDIDPRTALGFTVNGDIIMVTMDGKETYNVNRTGMTFTEVATILVREGAWIGANLDGGGSTTMVVRDELDGQPRILNTPCGENPYMSRGETFKVRSVANHFGLRMKQ